MANRWLWVLKKAELPSTLVLGTKLLVEAEKVAREKGFSKMAVIAAIGTRLYYENRGFKRSEYYMVKVI
jgi:histone acetyltransferase (RNA polymerase elongator complex component)